MIDDDGDGDYDDDEISLGRRLQRFHMSTETSSILCLDRDDVLSLSAKVPLASISTHQWITGSVDLQTVDPLHDGGGEYHSRRDNY